MKKGLLIILSFLVILLSGCKDSGLIEESELIKNGAILCDEYAFNLENTSDETGGYYVIYKLESPNFYKKYQDTRQRIFTGEILINNDSVLFIQENSLASSGISIYSLKDKKYSMDLFDNVAISKVYGLLENNVYLKTEDITGKTSFFKADIYTGKEDEITEKDIPEKFDYYVCKR